MRALPAGAGPLSERAARAGRRTGRTKRRQTPNEERPSNAAASSPRARGAPNFRAGRPRASRSACVRAPARGARPTQTSAPASSERKLAKLAKKTTALQGASLADSARHATWAERGRQPTSAASGDQKPCFRSLSLRLILFSAACAPAAGALPTPQNTACLVALAHTKHTRAVLLRPPHAPHGAPLVNGRPGFPSGFLGAGGRLPKAKGTAWAGFCCAILFLLHAPHGAVNGSGGGSGGGGDSGGGGGGGGGGELGGSYRTKKNTTPRRSRSPHHCVRRFVRPVRRSARAVSSVYETFPQRTQWRLCERRGADKARAQRHTQKGGTTSEHARLRAQNKSTGPARGRAVRERGQASQRQARTPMIPPAPANTASGHLALPDCSGACCTRRR